MKKMILAAMAFALPLTYVHAQKNTVLVYGDVSFRSTKTPESMGFTGVKNNALSLNPAIGYQFTNNLTAGITAAIGSERRKTNIEEKTNSFAVGPFIRYSHKLSEFFSIYGQLQTQFGSSKFTNTSPYATNSKNKFSTVNLFPAVFINLKKSFGLNIGFGGISYNSIKPSSGNTERSFDFTFGKTGSIGISKNF